MTAMLETPTVTSLVTTPVATQIPPQRRVRGSVFNQNVPDGLTLADALTTPIREVEVKRPDGTTVKSTINLNYTVGLEDTFLADGTPTGKKALVRMPTEAWPKKEVFGTVGKIYRPMQNSELFSPLGELAKVWPLHSITESEHGKVVSLVFRAEPGTITAPGPRKVQDIVDTYIRIINTFSGGAALQAQWITLRLVCTNGMTALKTDMTASIYHNDHVFNNYQDQIKLLNAQSASRDSVLALYQAMANHQFGGTAAARAVVQSLVNAAIPLPAPVGTRNSGHVNVNGTHSRIVNVTTASQAAREAKREQAQAMRTLVMQNFEQFNDEQPAFANTAWGAMNAVTEATNWGGWQRMARGDRELSVLGTSNERGLINGRAQAYLSSLIIGGR